MAKQRLAIGVHWHGGVTGARALNKFGCTHTHTHFYVHVYNIERQRLFQTTLAIEYLFAPTANLTCRACAKTALRLHMPAHLYTQTHRYECLAKSCKNFKYFRLPCHSSYFSTNSIAIMELLSTNNIYTLEALDFDVRVCLCAIYALCN